MASQGLSYNERFKLGRSLRRFVKANLGIEDETGYSEGYYLRMLDDFIAYGTPIDVEHRKQLQWLMLTAFNEYPNVEVSV